MKIPLHKLITAYILEKKRVHAGDLETFVKSVGAEAYTGRRRAQELTQPGHRNYNPNIRKIYEKGCVIYLWQEAPVLEANLQPGKVYERPPTPFVEKFLTTQWEKPKVENKQPALF